VATYNWGPIAPLTDRDRAIDLAAIRPLYDSWHASKQRLQQAGDESLKSFTTRLIRRLSIETGILERLYDLDRGTTEALVAKGFVEDLVSHSSTDIEPSRLIDVLRDQEAAIQLLMDCVSGNRPLTKGVIQELHTILTRHQDTTTAIDQFGNRRDIPLVKGRYKELPNNPRRPDGSMHEYCPPLQVDSEMENLLGWLSEYSSDDPIIVSAWLHHRFTQIHPYQDGNGRVARALITFILLRSDLLPLVIDRDLRTEYIDALEKADRGDLAALAMQFARLERTAILQALSVDAEAEIAHDRTLTGAVIESLAQKFGKRRVQQQATLRRVDDVAAALRSRARQHIERAFTELKQPLATIGTPEIHVADGGPDRENAHWYKYEVVKSANEAGKFANFSEAHYFLKSTARVERERLVFVVSFHHVGRELSGIMEATAFARLESFEESDDRERASEEFFVCSVEPFVFTHQTNEADIGDSFSRWLDTALAVAIKEYGDRL
jgi:Fic family protein